MAFGIFTSMTRLLTLQIDTRLAGRTALQEASDHHGVITGVESALLLSPQSSVEFELRLHRCLAWFATGQTERGQAEVRDLLALFPGSESRIRAIQPQERQ